MPAGRSRATHEASARQQPGGEEAAGDCERAGPVWQEGEQGQEGQGAGQEQCGREPIAVVDQGQPVELQGDRHDGGGHQAHQWEVGGPDHRAAGKYDAQGHGRQRQPQAQVAPEQLRQAAAGERGLGGDDAAQAELAQMQGVALHCQRQRPAAEILRGQSTGDDENGCQAEQGRAAASRRQHGQPQAAGAGPPGDTCGGHRLASCL